MKSFEYGYTLEASGERREVILGIIPASEFKAKKLECDRANRLERLPGPRGLLRHPATYFIRPVALPAAHPVRRMLRLAAMQRARLINTDQCAERRARYEQEAELLKAQADTAKAVTPYAMYGANQQ